MRTVRSLVAALLCVGCASTRFYSGKPPAQAASGYDARWHSALFFGALPIQERYDLDQICAGGWSEVRMEPDLFTVLTTLGSLFIYTPSRLTVVCAAEREDARPRVLDYPPPGSPRSMQR